jgi:hypothetical protein
MEQFKLIEIENARQVKSKVKSVLIIVFDIKGIVNEEFVLAGQTAKSAYSYDVLWRLHAKTSLRTLATKELAAVSRLRIFSRQGMFDQKQRDCRTVPPFLL